MYEDAVPDVASIFVALGLCQYRHVGFKILRVKLTLIHVGTGKTRLRADNEAAFVVPAYC
jgi:hypothetical protein